MWVDVARMQGSGVKVMGMLGGASDDSYSYLDGDFGDSYNLLSSSQREHLFIAFRIVGNDIDSSRLWDSEEGTTMIL